MITAVGAFASLHRISIGSVLLGVLLGGTASWWLNQPRTRWMEFEHLSAAYERAESSIYLVGAYEVERECEDGKGPVIWRAEATATDGQVAQYGPVPQRPPLTRGEHFYESAIPLVQDIEPDGWVVRILITCPGESPETIVSPPARVTSIRTQVSPP